jgi:hypothetical protein
MELTYTARDTIRALSSSLRCCRVISPSQIPFAADRFIPVVKTVLKNCFYSNRLNELRRVNSNLREILASRFLAGFVQTGYEHPYFVGMSKLKQARRV